MADRATCDPDRWNLFRLSASALVLGGGLFWAWDVFAGPGFLQGSGITARGDAGLWVFVTAAVFLAGLYWERLAAFTLGATALAVVGYGVFMGWGTAVWLQSALWIVAPLTISAILYAFAAGEHAACDLEARAAREMPARPAS
jgi:hypothetical protein